ncbi:MAG: cysteine desulfurase [Myxococcales bacterium]|nr:cysteine desulfurase [Myxococcales bacterium]
MIYLDNNATTPVDPVVFAAMTPYLTWAFGNASSSGHLAGERAADAVAHARSQVAALFRVQTSEVIWTSGATESNNLVLLGLCRATEKRKVHILTVATEHSSVLSPCAALANQKNVEVTVLPVDKNGMLSGDVLRQTIRPTTLLLSIMSANNEIGTLQPIEEIAAICKAKGVFLHVDAAQSAGKIPLRLDHIPIDFVSISGHKMNGPQGIGALIIRRRRNPLPLQPILWGGTQERGIRPGTLAVPNIVGMGQAAEIALHICADEAQRVSHLRDRLWNTLSTSLPEIYLNGHPTLRLPNNLSVVFRYVDAEALRLMVSDLALSTGSACRSASNAPSHVLKAIGLSDSDARSTIRFGLGRFTSQQDVDLASAQLISAVQKLRARHPEYAGVEKK